MKRDSRISNGSMGSFLLPPLHPGYNFSVETDLSRKKENRGSMSLEYAIESEYTDLQTKKEAIALVKKWEETEKLPLEHDATQDWINKARNHMGGKATAYIQKYCPEYKGISV